MSSSLTVLVTRYVIPRLIEMASKSGDGVIVLTSQRTDELNGVGWSQLELEVEVDWLMLLV